MSGADSTPVRVRGVRRLFGARVALEAVDLELAPGRIAGLVGPNGSGKTTLLKLLAGFLAPDGGVVRVFGLDPFRDRAAVMRRTRFAFAPPALLDALTAREHLVHLTRLGGSAADAVSIERALDVVGLTDRADERVRAFSFGMRQRLALAQALLPRPDLVVLDEPTEGLDPLAVLELRDVLRRLRDDDGVAVLLSSHLLVEVDELVDEMLVLSEGRTVFRGSAAELRRGGERLVLEVDDAPRAAAALAAHDLAPVIERGDLVLSVGAVELDDAARWLVEAGTRLRGYRVERPTLESALIARLRAGA